MKWNDVKKLPHRLETGVMDATKLVISKEGK